MRQPRLLRLFGFLLWLLIASFFFVPEQHQRNWLLYLAAAAAHVYLLDWQVLARAFGRGGWTVPALLAMPLLSLAWSAAISLEHVLDFMISGWCILAIHVGVTELVRQQPQTVEQVKQGLLLAANLGAVLAIGHWLSTMDPGYPRLMGWLGLDNPIHASILLLSTTLPVCNSVRQHRLPARWLLACAAPCAFAVLSSSRSALGAYLLVVLLALRPNLRVLCWLGGGALATLVGVAVLLGPDGFQVIWLDRGLSFRPIIWAEFWAAFGHCNPLVGCGATGNVEIELSNGEVAHTAHSLYLAILHHQGLLGLATFLAVVGWLLGSAYRQSTPTAPARDWVLMLAYALLASVTSGDQILVRTTLFWCYFWLPVMVLAAGLARAPLRPAID